MEPTTARTLLERERERLMELRVGLAAGDEGGERDGAAPLHAAAVAREGFERETERSIRHQVDADLRDVADALRRLDTGSYGRCETCGAALGDERLTAVPATRFCLDHEGMWEADRLALGVPAGRYTDGDGHTTDRAAAREAGRNLDLVEDQEEVGERVEVGPEDRALHVTDPGRVDAGTLSARDLAALEERLAAGEDEERRVVGAGAADQDEEER